MKVLLLTSAEPHERHGFSMVEKRFPLGLLRLAAILEQDGHDVEIADRFLRGRDYYPDGEGWGLVGIYSNTPCLKDTLHLLKYYEGFPTAVGGPHASLFPDTLHRADAVVMGEGEEVILDIVRGRTGLIQAQRIKDLDALPSPAYHLVAEDFRYDTDTPFALAGKWFNMNTSRGCPYDCTFCDVRRVWGRTYVMQNYKSVLLEARDLRDTYNVTGIYFREDNFTVNQHRVEDIALGMGALGLEWACETRVDTVDERLLNDMAEGGCVGLYIGFESGSQRMLDLYNKRTTIVQAEQVADWCYNAGIKIMGSFIVSHPEENSTDHAATTAFIERHKNRALVKVNLNKWRDFSKYEKFM